MTGPADLLARHLPPGGLVAIADGTGCPVGLAASLTEAARRVGGVRLLLGFALALPFEPDPAAFTDIRTFLPGYGLRELVRSGDVHYLPVRLGTVPALLHGPLRPDVLIAAVRPGPRGLVFGSEVAWMRAAVDAGVPVLAEINHALPAATADDFHLPAQQVVVIGETNQAPQELSTGAPGELEAAVGGHVADLVRPGAVVQFGPGKIGRAFVDALRVPVHVDSGLLTDAVVDLDEQGLLLGEPIATYLVGTERLYSWADGRPLLYRLEYTHDLARLASRPLVSVNTALQIDLSGQVVVDRAGSHTFAGVGGHPDYALAASRSPDGLSVIALPTVRGGRCTLVERLDTAVSTSRSDVDVVVTEHGSVDLRALDDIERARALQSIWR